MTHSKPCWVAERGMGGRRRGKEREEGETVWLKKRERENSEKVNSRKCEKGRKRRVRGERKKERKESSYQPAWVQAVAAG